MLNEVICSLFRKEKITFRNGLNVIIGDDDAKNSIGKSTALMVIDFVHGGNSFLDDKAGVIKALGHHHYNFSFMFSGNKYFFSRSTDISNIVRICDSDYSVLGEISLEDFTRKLKEYYDLAANFSSFRSLVGPFSRIWGKGALEPDQPFVAAPKEAAGVAVTRLIDLFGRIGDIEVEKNVLDAQKERRKLINNSMSAEIIPNIAKRQYLENINIISDNLIKIEDVKRGFVGALNAYEALFDDSLREMQLRKNELLALKTDLQYKVERLKREIEGITPRLTANIGLVAEFFPNVNVARLEQVEVFHKKISNIIKKELKDELAVSLGNFEVMVRSIDELEKRIRESLDSKGMPDDVFKQMFDLKERTDKAVNENRFFEKKIQLDEAIKLSAKRLDLIYTRIFLEIEQKINLKVRTFNKVVYGPKRNSSELRIKSSSSYSFNSPDDSGTGKSYAGLIGFDISLLSLTRLPYIIHDSVIYKNIEVAATRRIVRILAAVKGKQIFLSFDEAKKFGIETEEILLRRMVLKLGHNDLLYNKDWRDKKL